MSLPSATTKQSSGKRPRDNCTRQQSSLSSVSPPDTPTVIVVTTKTNAVVITGHIEENAVQMMLDSGSSLSLLRRSSLASMVGVQLSKRPTVQLVTAAGTPIPIADYVQAPIKIGNVKITQQFLVVDSLIAPVILGIDFMKRHKVSLDFMTTPVGVHFNLPIMNSH